MPAVHRRESMIALRATHQAFRIACEVGYEHVEVDRVTCSACGAEVDWRTDAIGNVVICPHCNAATDIPLHLRGRLLPPPDFTHTWPYVRPRSSAYVAIAWLLILAGAFVLFYMLAFIFLIPNL